MEENLRSARLAHTTLIFICGTIIVSVMGRNEDQQYAAALDQIERLRQQLIGDLPDSVRYAESALEKSLSDPLLRREFKPVAALPDLQQLTLPSLCEYLNRETGRVFVPLQSDLETALKNALKQAQVRELRMRLDPDEKLVVAIQPWSPDGVPTAELQAELFGEIRSDGWPVERYPIGKITGSFQPVRGVTFRTLLVMNDLLHYEDGRWIALRNARFIWDDFRERNIYSSIEFVKRKQEESQRQITVLGLSVEQRDFVLLGPVLVLFNLIYLLALVRHLASIRSRYEAVVRDFPWVVLFPGAVGRISSAVSFVVLPFCACAIMISTVWKTALATDAGIAIVASSLAIGCGALVQLEVTRMKRSPGKTAAGAGRLAVIALFCLAHPASGQIKPLSLEEVAKAMEEKANKLYTFLNGSPPVLNSLDISNNRLPEAPEVIAALDQEWRNETPASITLFNKLRDNNCSRGLTEFKAKHPTITEIFVTDRTGLIACLTDRTSDYNQKDERWWVDTESRNGPWFSDVEYDESSKSEAISIYIPIRQPGTKAIAGVAKAVLSVDKLAQELRGR